MDMGWRCTRQPCDCCLEKAWYWTHMVGLTILSSNSLWVRLRAAHQPTTICYLWLGSGAAWTRPWPGGKVLATKQEALAQYLWSVTQDPEAMAVHLQGIAFDSGQSLDSANSTLEPVLTTGKWLDMGNDKGKSAGPKPNHSVSICQRFFRTGHRVDQHRDNYAVDA